MNINPALFNCVVAACARLRDRGVSLSGEAVEEFAASYGYEEENDLSHVVDGRLATSAGSIDQLLTDIMKSTPSRDAAGNL
ncbi:hypothetical protein [Aquamicrobium soli]|uniref:DUF768 domain-containing protein n=1 Tax=Aquamicrobium soli TaxID=1811518 RepID=A0ABV7K8L9_9HYPH